MSKHCIVIGAGHAGGRAVEALRKHEYDGAITLIGEEPTLPFERPPLSKQYLKEPVEARLPLIRPESWYAESRVDVHLNARVTAINTSENSVTLDNGNSHSWSHLLLTTGGSVRRIPVPGAELDGIHYIRGVADSQALHHEVGAQTRVAVIGGGFIGLEAAAVLRDMGAHVTVIEAADRLMGRAVLPVIAEAALSRFRANGVEVLVGTQVTGFEGDTRVAAVTTSTGERVECDVAVVGIGIVPDLDIAMQAGIQVDDGIVVDAHCQTSAAGIYAAGDVTRHFNPRYGRYLRLESWQNAQNQAIAAARNICGDAVEYADVPWFWSDQFDFKIQAAGAPENVTSVVVRGDVSADLLAFEVAGDRVVGLQSLNAVKDMRRARKLLETDRSVDLDQLADDSVPVKQLL